MKGVQGELTGSLLIWAEMVNTFNEALTIFSQFFLDHDRFLFAN